MNSKHTFSSNTGKKISEEETTNQEGFLQPYICKISFLS